MWRDLIALLALLACAGASSGVELGPRRPTAPLKPPASAAPNVPDPDRQGGDTIADATIIPEIPFNDTGTTTGYTDDYDEVCPYSGSTAPDVVYAYTPPMERVLTFDMFGSSYDTKIYLYDQDLNLVACNDDYYPDYVSLLENVPLAGGVTYYLVIDGWNGDHGDYVLNVIEYEPCELECPPGGMPEGEPPLEDGYLDAYNGGCNSPEFGNPFQDLYGDADGNLVFCGVAGWYQFDGSPYRDTDWFNVHAGPDGNVVMTADAEFPVRAVYVTLHDCNALPVYPQIVAGGCAEESLEMPSAPGAVLWLFIGATTFEPPWPGWGNEFDYVLWFTGLAPQPVATETATWTTVKSLFR